MITGTVAPSREAIISLTLQGTAGQERRIEAIVDTGFNGFLTLPLATIHDLGLSWRKVGRAVLADGTERLFDIYEGTVQWNDSLRRIPIDSAEVDPLLGMSLLYGHELRLQAIDGGIVTIAHL